MRLHPLAVLAGLVLTVPAPAQAARPSNGSPTKAQPVATFVGEAAGFGPNLAEQTMRPQCRQPFCDGYVISVPKTLPKGTSYALTITAQDAAGFTDVFVTDPPGTKTYHPGAEGSPSNEVVLEDPVAGDWLVQIWTNAFFATSPGRYTGRLELRLPPEPQQP